MTISVHFTFHIFFWLVQDFVSCDNMKTSVDFVTVELGDPLTLNCTYNCSTGFVRGCWTKADISDCQAAFSKTNSCTTSLYLFNVSTEDLKKNYTCYTVDTEDPRLPQKTERIVVLQLQAQGSDQQGTVTPETETKNASLPAQTNNSSGGEFTGIKVLATVTVLVATVLAALAVYLCFNRSKQNWNGEPVVSRSSSPQPPHAVLLPMKGTQSTQNERVTLRIPQADNDSDTEVPYADIMITVRGVSTPELTQVGYLTAGDQKEWWGDESRCHLQASRSADRLHVPQPREVSRKMSTNSEYAVITYA